MLMINSHPFPECQHHINDMAVSCWCSQMRLTPYLPCGCLGFILTACIKCLPVSRAVDSQWCTPRMCQQQHCHWWFSMYHMSIIISSRKVVFEHPSVFYMPCLCVDSIIAFTRPAVNGKVDRHGSEGLLLAKEKEQVISGILEGIYRTDWLGTDIYLV